MKLIASLFRRFRWINLPGAILMVLLQRTPVMTVVAALDEMVIASPVGTVLKSVLATVAALGAVNTLVGASALNVSAGTSTGITVAAGVPMSVSFSLPGSDSTFNPTAKWTLRIAGGSSFPPGLSFSGLTTAGTVNEKFPQLSGTPTTAGIYDITLEALSADNSFSSGQYPYRVTVTGSTNTAPAITTQPASQTVTVGNSVTFTAAASGTPTPTFQWKKDGVNIGGATNSSYTIASVIAGDAGSYTVVATNSVNSATSNPATLTVNAVNSAPAFTTQPANQTVTVGDPVTFSAAASGTPTPTYQWKKGGVDIGGATGNTFTIVSTTLGDAGTYTVVATNSVNSVTSNPAILTVNAVTVAPAFTTQPASQTVTVGGPVTFSAAASGTPTPTYQWKKDGVAIGGATSNTFTIVSTLLGDAGSYTVVATNSVNSATSNPAVLTVNGLVAVRSDLDGDGKSDVFLSNTVTGDRAMWFMNGTAISTNAFAGTVPVEWTISGTGDFNGDGKADVFWTNTATGDRAMWLLNGSTIIGGGFMGTVAAEWAISGTGDCNGDGKADLVWTNTTTGERAMWLMNGTTITSGASLGVVPVAWAISGTGDFDGDGKSDILLSNTATGDRVIWFMNGSTIATNAFAGTVPVEWTVSGLGDFNGDGKADIFWTNTLTGDRAVWLMNGNTNSAGGYLGSIPVEWVVSNTGDYNGDGKADILWSNTATGERAMWLMNGITLSGGASLGVVPVEWVPNR